MSTNYVTIIVANGDNRGETAVRIWNSGQVEVDYRGHPRDVWTPVDLLGGSVSFQDSEGNALAGIALDAGERPPASIVPACPSCGCTTQRFRVDGVFCERCGHELGEDAARVAREREAAEALRRFEERLGKDQQPWAGTGMATVVCEFCGREVAEPIEGHLPYCDAPGAPNARTEGGYVYVREVLALVLFFATMVAIALSLPHGIPS